MTFENKYTPAARKKAVDQMIGRVRERLAKAKASVADVRASRKPDQVDAPDVAEVRKIEAQDDLVIENTGTPMKDFHLSPGGQAGQILFEAQNKPEPEECPDKLEPNPLNLVARESLERQISDLMDKVNQGRKEADFLFKDALNVLEFARTTAYTHPMGEVSVNLFEGASRLSDIEPELSRTANRLANLAMEVKQSEQIRGGK